MSSLFKILLFCFLSTLYACGGGNGRDKNDHVETPEPSQQTSKKFTVSGSAIKGVIKNAEVTLFGKSGDSANDEGEGSEEWVELASVSTDSNGHFAMDYSSNKEAAAYKVVVTSKGDQETQMVCDFYNGCGSYSITSLELDENQDGIINFGESFYVDEFFSMSAVWLKAENNKDNEITVSPLTSAAAQLALGQGDTMDAIAAGNQFVKQWAKLDGELPFIPSLDLTSLDEVEDTLSLDMEQIKHAVLSASIGQSQQDVSVALDRFEEAFQNCEVSLGSYDFYGMLFRSNAFLDTLGTLHSLPSNQLEKMSNEFGSIFFSAYNNQNTPVEGCQLYQVPGTELDRVKEMVSDIRTLGNVIKENKESWKIDVDAYHDKLLIAQDLVQEPLLSLSESLSKLAMRLSEYQDAGHDWTSTPIVLADLTVTPTYEEQSLGGEVTDQALTLLVHFVDGENEVDLNINLSHDNELFRGTIDNPQPLDEYSMFFNGTAKGEGIEIKLSDSEIKLADFGGEAFPWFEESGIELNLENDDVYFNDAKRVGLLLNLSVNQSLDASNVEDWQGMVLLFGTVSGYGNDLTSDQFTLALQNLNIKANSIDGNSTLQAILTSSDFDLERYYYEGSYYETKRTIYDGLVKAEIFINKEDLPNFSVAAEFQVAGMEYSRNCKYWWCDEYDESEFDALMKKAEVTFSFNEHYLKIINPEGSIFHLENQHGSRLTMNLDEKKDVGYLGLNYSDSPIYGVVSKTNDDVYIVRYSDGEFESLY